ncbi:MAG: hypothetical protein ACK4GJ_01440 [bacterium]
MKLKIFIFLALFSSFLMVLVFSLEKYYQNVIINYTFENFYTGYVDGRLFLAKNLFQKTDSKVLIFNGFNFSEGVFIDRVPKNLNSSQEYFLLSNTNSFYNLYSLLLNYFDEDLAILRGKLFRAGRDYFLVDVHKDYLNGNENYFLLGIIKNVFDVDLVLSIFDGSDIKFSINFGTSYFDYPLYFSRYIDDNFNGYLMISLIEKNIYRDFTDLRLAILSKRFNSDSILVSFLKDENDKNFKIVKYYSLSFPRNIVDYSVIKRSVDSVLIRVDFVDKVSGYYIATNFINIDFNGARITGVGNDIFNQFYQDNFVNLKNFYLKFESVNVNPSFSLTKLERR